MKDWVKMRVDYAKMLAEYEKNMETNLRGFSGGPPPFECWVPYAGDHDKSINDLMDTAKSAGHEVITVDHGDLEYNYYSDRARQAELSIAKIIDDFGLNTKTKVVGLKKNVLTLDYDESEKDFHFNLIKIEAELNKRISEKFDIQTLNIDDKNRRKACGKR